MPRGSGTDQKFYFCFLYCMKAGEAVSDLTPVHWLGCDLSMTLDFVKAHRWGAVTVCR